MCEHAFICIYVFLYVYMYMCRIHILGVKAHINESLAAVWDSNRIKLFSFPFTKHLIFILASNCPPPPPFHSDVTEALCRRARLRSHWQRQRSRLTLKLQLHVVFAVFRSLLKHWCAFPNKSPKSVFISCHFVTSLLKRPLIQISFYVQCHVDSLTGYNVK